MKKRANELASRVCSARATAGVLDTLRPDELQALADLFRKIVVAPVTRQSKAARPRYGGADWR